MGWIKEGLLDLVPFSRAIKSRKEERILWMSDALVDIALITLGLIAGFIQSNWVLGVGIYVGGKLLIRCVDVFVDPNSGAFR